MFIKDHENNIHSSEVCLQTLVFHKVSVCFYSLAPMRNKCVYAVSVPFLVVLLFVFSSECWTWVSSAVTIQDKKASPIWHSAWNIRVRGWCARWVSQSLTIGHKNDRRASSSELLAHCDAEGEARLSQRVTAVETWVHRFEPQTQRSKTRNSTDRAYTTCLSLVQGCTSGWRLCGKIGFDSWVNIYCGKNMGHYFLDNPHRWEDNIKMEFKEVVCEDDDWIQLVQNRSTLYRAGNLLLSWASISFSRCTCMSLDCGGGGSVTWYLHVMGLGFCVRGLRTDYPNQVEGLLFVFFCLQLW
jgi:hypothetical protein